MTRRRPSIVDGLIVVSEGFPLLALLDMFKSSMQTRVARIALLLAASLCGCGGSSDSNGYNRPSAPKHSEEEIAAALGVHRDESGIAWEDNAQECVASVIMTTPDQVKLYADAGDPVATNPSGTVGVKVGTYQGVDARMCFDRFQTALKKLE